MSESPAQEPQGGSGSLATDADTFFSLSDLEVLELVRNEFPHELARLTRAYSIRDQGLGELPTTPSPSRLLFDADYDEVNRTLVGLLALRWIVYDQYEVFTASQPDSVRLTRESFDWLRALVYNALGDEGVNSNRSINLHTLITSLIINDLGKDPQLVADYKVHIGGGGAADISSLNHDAILWHAAEAGLVPSFVRLSGVQRSQVLYGLRLGAYFNFGQLAQAESPPASLLALIHAPGGDQQALDLHIVEQLLDISGAAGHMDWTCAKKLIEPIADAYRNVCDAVSGVLAGRLSLGAAYDSVLERRAARLAGKGFRKLSTAIPHDRALMRLLCMGGAANLETAQLYDHVLRELTTNGNSVGSEPVRGLNVDGLGAEPAVQPTYMPALLTQALLGDGGQRSKEQRAAALASAFRFLARLMQVPPSGWPQGAVIMERNVLGVVKDVVQTSEFHNDPSILDRVDIPTAVVVAIH